MKGKKIVRACTLLLAVTVLAAMLSVGAFAAPTPTPAATPVPIGPTVTQNPQEVTVVEGGSAGFYAAATDWVWCAWRFISPEGEEVIFDVTGPVFPGLKVYGGNSTTFDISNVPMELNGWMAVCLFSNDADVWSYSSGATITVLPGETPASAPTETPAPTEEPTEAPTQAPTQAPTEAPAPTAEPVSQQDNTKLFVIGGVAAVALICATVIILTLSKRGRKRR